jgi:hypothetical protein
MAHDLDVVLALDHLLQQLLNGRFLYFTHVFVFLFFTVVLAESSDHFYLLLLFGISSDFPLF